MANEASTRRDLLQILAALPLATAWPDRRQAQAQGSAGGPGKVDTKGLTAKIKYENVLSGYLGELNGKYKLRVTELRRATDVEDRCRLGRGATCHPVESRLISGRVLTRSLSDVQGN